MSRLRIFRRWYETSSSLTVPFATMRQSRTALNENYWILRGCELLAGNRGLDCAMALKPRTVGTLERNNPSHLHWLEYCLQDLVRRGLVRAKNFSNGQDRAAYMYLLTSRGIEQKASLTVRFRKIKTQEYEALHAEIEGIQ